MEKQDREKGNSCDEAVSSQDYGTTALRVPRGAANYSLCSSLASLQVWAQLGDFNWNSLEYLVSSWTPNIRGSMWCTRCGNGLTRQNGLKRSCYPILQQPDGLRRPLSLHLSSCEFESECELVRSTWSTMWRAPAAARAWQLGHLPPGFEHQLNWLRAGVEGAGSRICLLGAWGWGQVTSWVTGWQLSWKENRCTSCTLSRWPGGGGSSSIKWSQNIGYISFCRISMFHILIRMVFLYFFL